MIVAEKTLLQQDQPALAVSRGVEAGVSDGDQPSWHLYGSVACEEVATEVPVF